VPDNVIVLHAMHWPDEIRDPASTKWKKRVSCDARAALSALMGIDPGSLSPDTRRRLGQ
jgi:non-homologous end joining protein Ku